MFPFAFLCQKQEGSPTAFSACTEGVDRDARIRKDKFSGVRDETNRTARALTDVEFAIAEPTVINPPRWGQQKHENARGEKSNIELQCARTSALIITMRVRGCSSLLLGRRWELERRMCAERGPKKPNRRIVRRLAWHPNVCANAAGVLDGLEDQDFPVPACGQGCGQEGLRKGHLKGHRGKLDKAISAGRLIL